MVDLQIIECLLLLGFISAGAGALIGGAVSGGSSIVGGILSSQAAKEREQDARSFSAAREDTFIQRRVQDAVSAGVHPLYALGAPGYSAPTGFVGGGEIGRGVEAAGQDVGSAISRAASSPTKQSIALDLRIKEASVAESDARKLYYQSLTARNQQTQDGLGIQLEGGTPGLPDGKTEVGRVTVEDEASPQVLGQYPKTPGEGIIEVEPSRQITKKRGEPETTAGTHAFYRQYDMGGFKLDLPQSEEGPAEALESTPWWMWPGIISHNSQKYGPGWGFKFWDWVTMQSPERAREMKQKFIKEYRKQWKGGKK